MRRSGSRCPDGPGAAGGAVSTPQNRAEGLNCRLSPAGRCPLAVGTAAKEERTFSPCEWRSEGAAAPALPVG